MLPSCAYHVICTFLYHYLSTTIIPLYTFYRVFLCCAYLPTNHCTIPIRRDGLICYSTSWGLDVPFGGLVDFGLGAPFLGQKTTFLVTNLVRAVSLEPLGFEISYFNTMLTMDERCAFYKKKLKIFVKKAIFRSFKNHFFAVFYPKSSYSNILVAVWSWAFIF